MTDERWMGMLQTGTRSHEQRRRRPRGVREGDRAAPGGGGGTACRGLLGVCQGEESGGRLDLDLG